MKRKQKMEDKNITQEIVPENFLELRAFTGYSHRTSGSWGPREASVSPRGKAGRKQCEVAQSSSEHRGAR